MDLKKSELEVALQYFHTENGRLKFDNNNSLNHTKELNEKIKNQAEEYQVSQNLSEARRNLINELTYKVHVHCNNCGWQGNLLIAKGRHLESGRCTFCFCKKVVQVKTK